MKPQHTWTTIELEWALTMRRAYRRYHREQARKALPLAA